MFKSFADKISVYVILLTAVLFLITAVTVNRYSYRHVRSEAVTNAFSQLKALNMKMEGTLGSISTAMNNIAPRAERLALNNSDTADFLGLLRDVLANTPQLTDIVICLEPYFYQGEYRFAAYGIKEKDSIRTYMIHRRNYEYIYYDWYVIPRCTGNSYWTDPYIDKAWGQLSMCSYSVPLKDREGRFIGAFCAGIETDWFTDMIDSIQLYDNSYNFLIGKTAGYIVHPDPEYIINETVFTHALIKGDSTLADIGRRMISGITGMEEIDISGEPSMVFFTPVRSNGWSIATVCPKSDIFAEVYRISRAIAIIALISIVVMAFIIRLTIYRATRPLTLLAKSADRIAEGEFNVPIPDFSGDDEVGRLGRSFSTMQTSLASYMERLRRTTAAKERIESELSIAREIQMGMVPKTFPPYPERDDIDIYAILNPAKEIGGDLYDFFIKDNSLFFAIGDVSGKGVPASLLMAVTRSHFRSVASTFKDPAAIIASMNKALSETNDSNMFVTFFTGIMDLSTGDVKYSNAGHNPPMILTPSGQVIRLNPDPNLPIGFFPDYKYTDGTFSMEPGSTIILYTDGLTEAENAEHELYGESRLTASIAAQIDKDAASTVAGLYSDVEHHVNGAAQSDDLTILAIKYIGNNSMDCRDTRILSLDNQVSELTKLSAFVEQTCSEAGIDQTLTMSINLALEEAVSNVIFYAFPKGETGHRITVKFTLRGNELRYTIFDRGIPFNPLARADADITLSAEDRNIGGLGIFLVKQIMDRVEYERKGAENILKLTKII